MSEYHVLSKSGSRVIVVFHVAIPNTTNLAGVNYRTAVVNSGRGGTTTMQSAAAEGDGKISMGELTQIQSGEVYEQVTQIDLPSDLTTNTQIRDYIDSMYNAAQAQVLTQLQEDLRYFGFNRNVP